jgi:general secretion pathway protein J
MVSVGILALVSLLIYGAFDGMSKARKGVGRVSERYRQGRAAIRRISNELGAAFLTLHQPINMSLIVRNTCLVGTTGSPADRLDFTSFSHRRLARDSHESDQNELSYFGSQDPDVGGKTDLARREQPIIDIDPRKGGSVAVMAEDIDLFDLRYLDPTTGMWQETWDTTQATGQLNRLPLQVKVTLVLRNGPGGANVPFVARVPLAIGTPLTFAIPR